MPLLFPEIPVCVYCGKELPQGEVCPTCAKFLKRYEVFGRVKYSFACCGAYHYNQLASWIVQAFKFEGARWLSGYLSRMIWRAVQKERFEAVSFVPLHPKRLKQRGFNQAELLAEQIGQLSKRPCFDLLERNRNTRTQSHLPHEVREENVRDAFDLKMEVPLGQRADRIPADRGGAPAAQDKAKGRVKGGGHAAPLIFYRGEKF